LEHERKAIQVLAECPEQFAKGIKMFKKILVAYDGSPEAGRALIVGVQLAKSLKADLSTVYVFEKVPAYAARYVDFGVNGASIVLPRQASQYYE
jgi:nucleotide-binding universal stress UspA family protein